MGATSSTAVTSVRLPTGMNNLVGELGNDVQYERGMGSSRFLRAIKARHRHGPLVVKTFLKPELHYSLRPLVRRIRVEREALADVPNILTYQKVVETDTAGYLIRQWIASNLYDRISTRPFLTIIEKKWITYQLLNAMNEARKRKVPHGDLKSENVLVTSSLSVYITDFSSSFKQVYLPLNDPSDFNFYFGTSGRRTCYVAPERFYSNDSDIAKSKASARAEAESNASRGMSNEDKGNDRLFKRDGKVTEAMDVFSLGCVIAELWRDGAPIFTLMQLFKYREGSYDIEPALADIADVDIRDMIKKMISLDPFKRDRFEQHLEQARNRIFPNIFYTFLHRYLTTLQRTSPQASAMAAAESKLTSSDSVTPGVNAAGNINAPSVTNSDAARQSTTNESDLAYIFRAEADERIEKMYEEWVAVTEILDGSDTMQHVLSRVTPLVDNVAYNKERSFTPFSDTGEAPQMPNRGKSRSEAEVLPLQLCIPGIDVNLCRPLTKVDEDGPALLILSPLLANLRNALRPSTKLHAIDLLMHLSSTWLSDEAKLDRVLPYLITLFDDESVMVRAATVRSTVQLLLLVDFVTFSNALSFTEYVMPNIRLLIRDPSSLVRSTYAACLMDLIKVGRRFLQMTSAMRAEGIFSIDMNTDEGVEKAQMEEFMEGDASIEARYDRQLASLRFFFQEQVTALLSDSSPAVKRTLLAQIEPLCTFFGSSLTSDVLISHMITFLNDRSWLLRMAFFDAIVHVAKVAGQRSFEAFILPLILQTLSDPEEFVVYKVMESLYRLLQASQVHQRTPAIGLLSTARVYDVLGSVSGFLCHPNHWLRTISAMIISLGSSALVVTDQWAMVYPSIRPLLRCDIYNLNASSLLFAVKSPLSREVVQKAIQWAYRAKSSSGFWKAPEQESRGKAGLSNALGKEGIGLLAGRSNKAVSKTPIQRSEEDDAFLDNLRSSGLSEEDEVKLVGLRDYLARLAKSTTSPSSNNVIGGNIKPPSGYTTLATNQEDVNLLPPLQIKPGLNVQSLDDVTPLTIFFTTSKGNNGTTATTLHGNTEAEGSIAPTASLQSQVAQSSFTSRIAKRRLGGIRSVSDAAYVDPLDELKRRMNEATISDAEPTLALPGTPVDDQDILSAIPRPSARPTSPASINSILNQHHQGHQYAGQSRLGLGKALPAIASTSANAIGTIGSANRVSSVNNDKSTRDTPLESVAQKVKGDRKNSVLKGQNEESAEGSTFKSTYEGHDIYIRAHLEAVYFANFRNKHPAWGPTIQGGTSVGNRRRGIGNKSMSSNARAASSSSSSSSNRRPEGNLIAYFTEHIDSITSIAISPDYAFFLSGSADGSIKVWDTARLEKNVTSKSRCTYTAQRGKITSLIMLEGSHCAASAASDGSVHVIRVEISGAHSSSSSLPKYGKVRLVSNFQLSNPEEYVTTLLQSSSKSGTTTKEAATLPSNQVSSGSSSTGSMSTTLILATSKNRVIILDLRTMQVMTTFQIGNHLGSISSMCLDEKNIWLLMGTIGGVMCLWDLRFQLLLKTWRVGKPNESGVLQINHCALHPSKGKGKWVMIAFERLNISFEGVTNKMRSGQTETLVETWDIDRGICVERFEGVYGSQKDVSSNQNENGVIQEAISLSESSHLKDVAGEMETPLGLESAASGIERLVKMMELHQDDLMEDNSQQKGKIIPEQNNEHVESNGEPAVSTLSRSNITSANVKIFIATKEGYSSSTPSHSAQISGGWLDAGRLAQEDGRADEGTASGPAGYLITAGQDRKIRFWDLGRAEKSTCLINKEERGEFKGVAPTDKGQEQYQNRDPAPFRFVHQMPYSSSSSTNSSSNGSTRGSTSRSPLLLQQQTNHINTLMKAHKDSITALGIIESPFRCIVAGDQAGTIRVWE